ncbi:MAG: hypothetical protein A2079_03535 [Geobacteraceae bacterium GWC2_48_7]|nr:MAG: hypothetical protein A2079_03535 [Geobacteraceae bacterium GWC2_48_7]
MAAFGKITDILSRSTCGGILLLALLFLSGCGYTLSGSAANRIADGQTLWVAFISNETTSPTAQTVLRRALLEEAHQLCGLVPSGSEASSDLHISGVLRSYSLQAISYNAADQAREYRLLLVVELELKRKGELTPFWKGTVKAEQDFPVDRNNNLAFQRNAEEAALTAVSRSIARKFLTAVEQNY